MAQGKRLRRIMFRNFDNLVKACEKTAKPWGRNTVPLGFLYESIKLLKQRDYESKHQKIIEAFDAYNNTLKVLYETCEKKCNELETKQLSIEYLKKCIQVIKESASK